MVNILITDDNESNIYVLEMLVEEWFDENNISDYNIDHATNGQEALEQLDNNAYDLIYLDIMMPVMNGFEALEKIRERDLSKQPKVIIASAIIDDFENKNKAKSLKANAFIVKPLSYDTINIVMSKYLKNDNSVIVSTDHKLIDFGNENEQVNSKLSAIDLQKEYNHEIVDENNIEDLNYLINNLHSKIAQSEDLDLHLELFTEILEKARILLISISELNDLLTIINKYKMLVIQVNSLEIFNQSNIDNNILKSSQIIMDWFNSVFIEKNSDNILSITSELSNQIEELKNLIEK